MASSEIRLLTCKRCGCTIDTGLCGYMCELDDRLPCERNNDDMEVRIYEFVRSEPVPAAPEDVCR